jgi:hypothetical protein
MDVRFSEPCCGADGFAEDAVALFAILVKLLSVELISPTWAF